MKQSFHPPAEGEVLLFCLSKREVPKRKRHPAYALSGHRATAPAMPQLGHPCPRHGLTPNWFASMRTTLRAFPPPARRCRGAPGKATRILRVLFRTARFNSRARAARSDDDAALLLLLHCFSPSAGHDGPLLYPGPLCGGELGTTGPQGHRHECRCLFARTGVLSKSPALAHELAAQGWAASATHWATASSSRP